MIGHQLPWKATKRTAGKCDARAELFSAKILDMLFFLVIIIYF